MDGAEGMDNGEGCVGVVEACVEVTGSSIEFNGGCMDRVGGSEVVTREVFDVGCVQFFVGDSVEVSGCVANFVVCTDI